MITMLLAAAAVSATPQPGELKTFKDWTVGCDNGWRCQAESLITDEQITNENGDAGTMEIIREGGANGVLTVAINLVEARAGRYLVLLDGKRFGAADVPEGGVLTYSGTAASTLAAAITNAGTLEVRDAQGKSVAGISLAGSSATLRYMDDRQQRTGSVTALVARGSKNAASVPAPPALPVIKMVAPAPHPLFKPTAQEIAALRQSSGCAVEEDERATFDSFVLDGTNTLLLISCGSGAYNISAVAFIANARGGKRSITPARFDFAPGWSGDTGQTLLVNASFDGKTGTLSSFAKGRGIGDCGSSEDLAWDGTRFRLTGQSAMGECRGNMNWITLWRALVTR